MRVVMVSKALVVGAYQRKLEELARLPDIALTAVVPPAWHDSRGRAALEHTHAVGYDLIVAPVVLNGQYHLHFYPTLGRLLRRLRPDILHVDEEPYNLATWHALRLAESSGASGLFFTWQNLNRRYPWPFRYFEAVNYRRAVYAIAGNQAAMAVLRAKGYKGPVAVIPQFGVDPDLFCPRQAAGGELSASTPAAAGKGRADGRLVIGYIGGLVPEKGVDLLLRACAGLPFSGWILTIAGDGQERPRLEALAQRLGICSQVWFRGRIPSQEIPAHYRTLDLLVLPSVSRPNWVEQFGRVLIEAMACGVPVIGSSSGEIPHVIGDAGIVFPEGDVIALSKAIAGLVADPQRQTELVVRGRQRVLKHFTQEQVAADTYRVYREVMGQGQDRPPGERRCVGVSRPQNERL